jgi:poly(3-hydroxybutyrate) depolymerase
MRFFIASLVSVAGAAYSLSAAATRYLDPVFNNVSVTYDVLFGSNVNYDGNVYPLKLDLYQPTGDTANARPLMIFFYGGGFTVGDKSSSDIVRLCTTFAKMGYVTAAPNYRLNPNAGQTETTENTATLRAVQDGKAAVRYLRSKKSQYRIDDTKIIMGGTSAGGDVAVDCAYWDQNEIPAYIDTTKVGGIEGASGTPGVSSAINGVINCWGLIIDSTWLYNNKIPVINFAGTADNVVPYDVGFLNGDHKFPCVGSACIHRVLTRLNVKSVLRPFVGMQHGMGTNDPRFDTLLTMSTQFAYDILFKSPSKINASNKTNPLLRPSLQQVFLGHSTAGNATQLLRFGTTYSLNGGIVKGWRNGSSPLNAASGVYIYQPPLK